jgi:hypothetical protein
MSSKNLKVYRFISLQQHRAPMKSIPGIIPPDMSIVLCVGRQQVRHNRSEDVGRTCEIGRIGGICCKLGSTGGFLTWTRK